MRKLTIALLAALAVAVAAVACGDDDDGDGGETSPTVATSTRTARPSPTDGEDATPTNHGGDEKPATTANPDDATPAPTEAGPQPTPAAEGIPATAIEDPAAFFSTNYPGKPVNESQCIFSPVTYVVTCGSDKYAPDPPLTGQDVACALLTIDKTPVAIRCTSQEPLLSIYYEIQE